MLAEHGCTLTRSFCYWPDFVPELEVLDEDVMDRFVDFLDLHQQAGMGTIPTFIVGHMSGANSIRHGGAAGTRTVWCGWWPNKPAATSPKSPAGRPQHQGRVKLKLNNSHI